MLVRTARVSTSRNVRVPGPRSRDDGVDGGERDGFGVPFSLPPRRVLDVNGHNIIMTRIVGTLREYTIYYTVGEHAVT